MALYLLNCPQYVIAYFAALKLGAKVTPISPVYTSKEVKHQLEDSEAETIICQDILYDNVEKTGLSLKNVILTNIAEYLPLLKKHLGKSALGKVYGGMHVPTPKYMEEAGLMQFQTLIKKYPPRPPEIFIDPKKDIAALPYTGGSCSTSRPAGSSKGSSLKASSTVNSGIPLASNGAAELPVVSQATRVVAGVEMAAHGSEVAARFERTTHARRLSPFPCPSNPMTRSNSSTKRAGL